MDVKKQLEKLFAILDEADAYSRGIGKLYFDIDCVAPPDGLDRAGRDAAVIGKRLYSLTHSKRYAALLQEIAAGDFAGLTPVQKRSVEKLIESYEKEKNVSPSLAYRADLIFNQARNDWLRAKTASDFSMFRDSFGAVVDMTRKLISKRDVQGETPYDTLLDDFEKGGSIKQLDGFFADLKKHIVPLVGRITREGKSIRDDFLQRPVSVDRQEKFSRYLLSLEGLRDSSLVFMTTEHPFTTSFGPDDIRVTTHFYEENFVSNIFSTLHEGGHALFMQNEPAEYFEQHAADNMTSAMHECISRFYENIIGRSREFVSFIMPKLREFSGPVFDDVSDAEMYEAVNIASPGLIRMEADELTYCIHIMIRYELEKEFVNGTLKIDDVPEAWNSRYREYLGVEVPDDASGCLQDVHWTGGYGYFPSYALGNAYGAQILRTMEKDFDVFAAVGRGDLGRIGTWLTENVFPYASMMDPDEWIRKITGESLNVGYYTEYLERKFKGLYGLD